MSKILQEPAISFSPKFALQVTRKKLCDIIINLTFRATRPFWKLQIACDVLFVIWIRVSFASPRRFSAWQKSLNALSQQCKYTDATYIEGEKIRGKTNKQKCSCISFLFLTHHWCKTGKNILTKSVKTLKTKNCLTFTSYRVYRLPS